MTCTEAPGIRVGQLWRRRSDRRSFIPAHRTADGWLDRRGIKRTDTQLREAYVLVPVDTDVPPPPPVQAGQLWRRRSDDETFIPGDRLDGHAQWVDVSGRLMLGEHELRADYVLVRSDDGRIGDWWNELTDEQRADVLSHSGPTGPEWLVTSLVDARVLVWAWRWTGDDRFEVPIPRPVVGFLDSRRR